VARRSSDFGVFDRCNFSDGGAPRLVLVAFSSSYHRAISEPLQILENAPWRVAVVLLAGVIAVALVLALQRFL
jgi:hypothetical protein